MLQICEHSHDLVALDNNNKDNCDIGLIAIYLYHCLSISHSDIWIIVSMEVIAVYLKTL